MLRNFIVNQPSSEPGTVRHLQGSSQSTVFPFEPLLNRDMRHRSGCRSPVPMFFTGREPNDVTGPDFCDRATLELNPTPASSHNQRLPERGECANSCEHPAQR